MDVKQTGSFIRLLRKEKGLTQEELASELNVTNKTVSRWETGTGFPDVDSMIALSEFFGVSVNELLYGERALPAHEENGTDEEAQKKEQAQIACESLDLSMKKRRSSRAAKLLAAALAAVIALGAVIIPILGRNKKLPKVQFENDRYFCPYQASPQTLSPAKIIDIATGEVLVACPDPLCTHSEGSETCFFNFVQNKTIVRGAEYVDGHIFFAAERSSDDGAYMKLYDYNMSANRIDEVYTYDYIGSTLQLYGCGDMLYFTAITEAETNAEGVIADTEIIGLFAYDPQEKTVTLLDGNARYALFPMDVAFYENYYVFNAGYNQDEDRIIYCKRSYDGSSEELIEALPDGTPFESFGYQLKPNGFFASTEANGGVYLPDENRCLAWPVDSATTKPAVYKDSFYFTTRSSEITELGKEPATGTQARGYAYYNEVYVVDKDGSYKHYTIDSEYHFIIETAYDNIVMGRIVYRIRDNGDCIRDSGPDIIRIDLETGETTLYDTSMRSGFVRKTIITNVTLNDN